MDKPSIIKLYRDLKNFDELQKDYFDKIINLPMRKSEIAWHLKDGIKLPWHSADEWEKKAKQGLRKKAKEIRKLEKSIGEKAWCF